MINENSQFSDKQIVQKVLNGNTQDFSAIVKLSERLVAQIVRKMITNKEDQKDVVQDIYLKVYKNLASFRFQSRLSTWIANIAYNTSLNYLKKMRIPMTEIDTAQENDFIATNNTEVEIFRKETERMIASELNKLPVLYRTLVALYHIEELPNKEIAEITNLPEGTIKSYLYRARKTLKDNIESNGKREIYDQLPCNR